MAMAQETKPVIVVLPFTGTSVNATEVSVIENLVQSYISELNDFRLVSEADRDKVLSEWEFSSSDASKGSAIGKLLTADYLLYGTIGTVGDNKVLTLDVVKVQTGEKLSFSSINKSMSDLALGARALVRQALNRRASDSTSGVSETPEVITEDKIVGSWRGDKGLELVRVYPGGVAVAILSSGAKMELTYTIQDKEIELVQSSPNTERYYHPVPYAVARQLVSLAKPMRWRFQLVSNGSVLRGTKIATALRYHGDTIDEVIQDSSREAEWTKITR